MARGRTANGYELLAAVGVSRQPALMRVCVWTRLDWSVECSKADAHVQERVLFTRQTKSSAVQTQNHCTVAGLKDATGFPVSLLGAQTFAHQTCYPHPTFQSITGLLSMSSETINVVLD